MLFKWLAGEIPSTIVQLPGIASYKETFVLFISTNTRLFSGRRDRYLWIMEYSASVTPSFFKCSVISAVSFSGRVIGHVRTPDIECPRDLVQGGEDQAIGALAPQLVID